MIEVDPEKRMTVSMFEEKDYAYKWCYGGYNPSIMMQVGLHFIINLYDPMSDFWRTIK